MADEIRETIEDLPLRSGIPKHEPGLNGTGVGPEGLPHHVMDMFVGEANSRLIPPHWSRNRDKFLFEAVTQSDGFLIAMYNVLSRVAAIIPEVRPSDKEDEVDVFAAKVSSELLRRSWMSEIPMALFDLFTQDNGMFIELLDGTDNPRASLQPYEVAPGIFIPAIGFKHWESARCTRTGHPEWPVRIVAMDDKEYLVHKTRILFWADMPSPKKDLYGIGFCAASRILVNMIQMTESEEIVSDLLFDGMVGEILFGQPFTSRQLEEAFKQAERRSQEQGSPRYRRFVYVGIQDPIPGYKLEVQRIPLRRLPEGYEKAAAVTLFMYLMAAALSVDAREIYPATVSGATRADADTQHKKSRNKFIRFWIDTMSMWLDSLYVPLGAFTYFRYTDEAAELESVEARKALAESQSVELANGTITREIAASQMHDAGYLTEKQFEEVIVNGGVLGEA